MVGCFLDENRFFVAEMERPVTQTLRDAEGPLSLHSCAAPPTRFVELIRGYGARNSPSEVAARSVEFLDAMYRSAAQDGWPAAVYRRGMAAT